MGEISSELTFAQPPLSARPKETKILPRTKTTPLPATDPNTHRSARSTRKKPARVASARSLSPSPEFDAAARREEIAEVAYRNWLARANGPGSPEEDWLKAEVDVRAKYAQ
jgi:Protein of unknown function (DUF2934)